MQTARTARLLGFGFYGCMVGLAIFSFWKPNAAQVLLIVSGLIAIASVTIVVAGVIILTPSNKKRWARGEPWVIYGMYAVALAILSLGISDSAKVFAAILGTALLMALIIFSADKLGNDGGPTDHYY